MEEHGEIVKQIAADPGLLQRAVAWSFGAMGALITILLTWMGKSYRSDLSAVSVSIAGVREDQREFDDRLTRVEQHYTTSERFDSLQREVRSDIREIHNKIDRNHSEVMQAILRGRSSA